MPEGASGVVYLLLVSLVRVGKLEETLSQICVMSICFPLYVLMFHISLLFSDLIQVLLNS